MDNRDSTLPQPAADSRHDPSRRLLAGLSGPCRRVLRHSRLLAIAAVAPAMAELDYATPYAFSRLTLASAQAADAGDYVVTVTNALGSVTSSSATVTVSAAPPSPTPAGNGAGGGSLGTWFVLALLSAGVARTALIRSRH